MMRLICDCGNDMEFNTVDEETGEQTPIEDECEGQYATVEHSQFELWGRHDVVGIICHKCDKAIWLYT